MIEAKNIPDLFNTVVQSMRDTYYIDSFTDNGDDTYTIGTTRTKDLSNNDWITITGTTNFNGTTYKISNLVENTSFDIEKTSGLATESGIWTANAPYFIYGHLDEIIFRLYQKDNALYYKDQKYPLIILSLDIEERITSPNYYADISPTFIICDYTSKDYISSERYENKFVPVLHPIYVDLIQSIADSGLFLENKPKQIERRKWDRLYWGRTQIHGNDGNKLNDYLDAIELNVDLRIKNTILKCN